MFLHLKRLQEYSYHSYSADVCFKPSLNKQLIQISIVY